MGDFLNKWGVAPDGIQTTVTDIWSRADATPTQQIWLAPTAARIHSIVSTSTADASGGTGAGSVIVSGLTSWSTAEVSETVTLTGTDAVNTANSYVIIHRMKAVAQSSTTNPGVNAGIISATAASDSTVTAIINIDATPTPDEGEGQTQMAIYGVPSTKVMLLHAWHMALNKTAAAAATARFFIRVNENPDVQTLGYIQKWATSLQSTGVSRATIDFDIPLRFPGPCIVKIQAQASAADVDGSSGFDAEVLDK